MWEWVLCDYMLKSNNLFLSFFSSCFRDCFYSQMRQELWTSTLLELLNTLGTFEVWLEIATRLWEQRLRFKVMCLNVKLTRVRFLWLITFVAFMDYRITWDTNFWACLGGIVLIWLISMGRFVFCWWHDSLNYDPGLCKWSWLNTNIHCCLLPECGYNITNFFTRLLSWLPRSYEPHLICEKSYFCQGFFFNLSNKKRIKYRISRSCKQRAEKNEASKQTNKKQRKMIVKRVVGRTEMKRS